MLEHLFGSRTRIKLLSLFLRNPNEPMYVRELTRRVETQINAVRRELANLVRLGLIIESEAKVEATEAPVPDKKRAGVKRRYYIVNKTFPLLMDMTSLVVKAQLILENRLDREIAKMGDVRYLALLGLFVGKSRSPVDIFIVGEVQHDALQRLIASMEKDMGCEINFSLMTPEDYKYRRDMTDKFLFAILESPKNVLIDRLSDFVKE